MGRVLTGLLIFAVTISPANAGPASVLVRMRYASDPSTITIRATAQVSVQSGSGESLLLPGVYTFHLEEVRPPRVQWHVFPKTFEPSQSQERDAYTEGWRAQGYAPENRTFGRRFERSEGTVFDNRIEWVSLARCATEAEAAALKKRLELQQVWAWIRPEPLDSKFGMVRITGADGKSVARLALPVKIQSAAPLAAVGVDSGYWKERRGDLLLGSALSLEVGMTGALELRGEEPLEQYLRSVLPAEMPASWPAEALHAQAVCARSEVLANLAGKHDLEGFDFCTLEHCRAYTGLAGHTPATDAAVDGTAGEVLVHAQKITPTVFASNCGGWTENNENVWSGPANAVLRGRVDALKESSITPQKSLSQWLKTESSAYCRHDESGFRWVKKVPLADIAAQISKTQKVGRIKSIEPLQRGVSGRLRRVRIDGSAGSVTIEKELEIRRIFGGLPSALCTISMDAASGVVTFRGAGRGHGVGLCQHGTRGMAAAGKSHREILTHYFSGATVESMQ